MMGVAERRTSTEQVTRLRLRMGKGGKEGNGREKENNNLVSY